jgi:hypothetical protein
MNDHSEQDAPRIRIGPVASQLARQKSGGPTFTQAHLEDAIAELEASASLQAIDGQPNPEKLARSIFDFDSACDLP